MIQSIGGFLVDLKYGVMSSDWYEKSDGMVTYGIGFGGSISITVKNGQSIKLSADIITENGQKTAIDNDSVDWTVLYEKNLISFNSGNIVALATGETAVKAKVYSGMSVTVKAIPNDGYAVEAVQWSVGSGLILGKSDTMLNPSDNATRAEAATVFMRFTEMLKK